MTQRNAELAAGLLFLALGGILAWTALLMVIFRPWPLWLTSHFLEPGSRPTGNLSDPDDTGPMTRPLEPWWPFT